MHRPLPAARLRMAPSPHQGAPGAMTYGRANSGKAALGVAGLGLIAGVLLLPTLVVGPFIVKAFAPEWSYGRRVGASMAFGIVTGTLVQLATGAKGAK